MKNFLRGLLSVSSMMAIALVASTVNSACLSILHQPKVPESANYLKHE